MTLIRQFVRKTLLAESMTQGTNESRTMDEDEFRRLFPAAHTMIHAFIDDLAAQDEDSDMEVDPVRLHAAVVYGIVDGQPWTEWQDPSDPVSAGSDAIIVHDPSDGEPTEDVSDDMIERIQDMLSNVG